MMLTYKLSFTVLMETHILGARVGKIVRTLGFSNAVRVDLDGFSSGIWVMWNKSIINVQILEKHAQFILIEINELNGRK